MVATNEIKNGMTIKMDGALFNIIWFQHVKPGKGGAFVKMKFKNIRTGAVIDRTYRAGEELERAYLEEKVMEYLYQDGDSLWFMETETYEQHPFRKDMLSDKIGFLKENMKVKVTFHESSVVGLEIPTFVELKVIETEPGFKGDTVSNNFKPATVETGAIIKVPLFVKIGDKLKIDTRTGDYIQRA